MTDQPTPPAEPAAPTGPMFQLSVEDVLAKVGHLTMENEQLVGYVRVLERQNAAMRAELAEIKGENYDPDKRVIDVDHVLKPTGQKAPKPAPTKRTGARTPKHAKP